MFVEYRDLGQMDYKACWEYQQRLFDTLLRAKGTPAEGAGYLLLVEHPAVYTLGKSGHAENLLVGEEYLRSIGAEFYHIDRGGDITFHVSNPNGLDKKVAVRIPQWSKDYTLEVNGEAVELPVVDGFVTVDASAADTEIHLVLDMSVRCSRSRAAAWNPRPTTSTVPWMHRLRSVRKPSP